MARAKRVSGRHRGGETETEKGEDGDSPPVLLREVASLPLELPPDLKKAVSPQLKLGRDVFEDAVDGAKLVAVARFGGGEELLPEREGDCSWGYGGGGFIVSEDPGDEGGQRVSASSEGWRKEETDLNANSDTAKVAMYQGLAFEVPSPL